MVGSKDVRGDRARHCAVIIHSAAVVLQTLLLSRLRVEYQQIFNSEQANPNKVEDTKCINTRLMSMLSKTLLDATSSYGMHTQCPTLVLKYYVKMKGNNTDSTVAREQVMRAYILMLLFSIGVRR